jgi:hypothetical protein
MAGSCPANRLPTAPERVIRPKFKLKSSVLFSVFETFIMKGAWLR